MGKSRRQRRNRSRDRTRDERSFVPRARVPDESSPALARGNADGGTHTGAALHALVHSAVMLAGVLWLGWSVSFLLVAVWIEMLCLALVLHLMIGRSRHGRVFTPPASDAPRADAPSPTLRGDSNRLIFAVLALGAFLAFGGAGFGDGPDSLGPMWWWGGGDPRIVVLVGVLGAAIALRPSWRALRERRLVALQRAHQRQSLGVAHALMMLVTLPWLILVGGATLMLVALLLARGVSDYWLARMPH